MPLKEPASLSGISVGKLNIRVCHLTVDPVIPSVTVHPQLRLWANVVAGFSLQRLVSIDSCLVIEARLLGNSERDIAGQLRLWWLSYAGEHRNTL